MEVDLYKVRRTVGDSRRLGRQMESRKFIPDKALVRGIPEHLENFLDDSVKKYRAEIMDLLETPRKYEHIGAAGEDNLWRLEMLGIGTYSANYVTVIDFSNALDFALYKAFGCSKNCRDWIDNYDSVSKQLMTYNFDGSSDKFDAVFHDERVAQAVYSSVMTELTGAASAFNMTEEDKVAAVVYKFYAKILESIAMAKDYVTCILQSKYRDKTIVYRSKTFSSSILSTDFELNDTIEIICAPETRFCVPVRTYSRYAWMREDIQHETWRNLENWK